MFVGWADGDGVIAIEGICCGFPLSGQHGHSLMERRHGGVGLTNARLVEGLEVDGTAGFPIVLKVYDMLRYLVEACSAVMNGELIAEACSS